MSHVTAEYDGNSLTPDQIDLLHEDLKAELADFAEIKRQRRRAS